MKSFFVVLLLTSVFSAHAQPTLIAAQATENINACGGPANDYDNYIKVKLSLKAMAARLSAMPADSVDADRTGNLLSLMLQHEIDLANALQRHNEQKMVTVQVAMDRVRTIPANRLNDPNLPEERIEILPSHPEGNSITIPHQVVSITIYGARVCHELEQGEPLVDVAVQPILKDLFRE